MSNPSGTDNLDGRDAAEDEGYPSDAENDPVTEVIDIPGSLITDTAERRYTAPGFDAGSTQIIHRMHDEPTEVFFAGSRRHAAGPQTIAPRKPERPSWLIPILVALGALVAAGIVGFLLMHRADTAKAARADAVRSAIETFDTAVRNGDLTVLRSITCGQTNEAYVNYDDKAWADTFSKISESKQYPVVGSIDEVVVDGDHAEANVTSYMAFDPSSKSTRSFDLQFRDDQWKVCQAP